MPRGITPRRPARTGRHEGTGHAAAGKRPAALGTSRTGGDARPSIDHGTRSKKSYAPTAPARVKEILQRPDALYPVVTCALHHNSAWELLVATILSAQSPDVRVNRVMLELLRKYSTVQNFSGLT